MSAVHDIHLLVLVHGMWGNPAHLDEHRRIISEKYGAPGDGTELRVLLAETNKNASTYDGIDWGGERIAQEILDTVEKYSTEGSKVTRFSITGYSLGGLLSRYVVGILHQRHFFDDVSPVNFNTTATPHLGLPRYSTFWSKLASTLGPRLLSRTGEQFYATDKWSASGRPLLEVMADPDRIFFQAIALFQNIIIYANAVNDTTVPFVTAAIETTDPFVDLDNSGIEIQLDDKYTPLIKSYDLPKQPPTPLTSKPLIFTPTWFKTRKDKKKYERPLLPPFLQFKFPFNIVLWTCIPLLIPIVVTMAIVRLSLEQRSSRARIRLLEKDGSNSEKLIHILAELEKDMEDAVVDLIDSDGPDNDIDSSTHPTTQSDQQPILTPLQRKMATNLNRLPHLRKEFAFFPGARNSHAVIVSRDVKRFTFHKIGEGIIRHWGDNFVL